MQMVRVVLALLLLSTTGCGGDPDFACDIKNVSGSGAHGCTEIDELSDAQESLAPSLCSQLKGELVGSCPSDGDLGYCSVTQGGLTQRLHFYSGGGVTAATAEAACKQTKGTWTAN